MNDSYIKALIVGGSALAGGWGGSLVSARAGASWGARLGPWGIVAGAALGAIAGSVVARTLVGESSESGEAAILQQDEP